MRFTNKPAFVFLRSFVNRLLKDDISFLSGGVAFYGMLAIFPAMAGLVSLFGLVASPKMVVDQLLALKALFPPDVYKILEEQLLQLLAQPDKTLSVTVIISLLITIYSSTKGTKAMLAALNSVFRVTENRSWFFMQVLSFCMTLGGMLLSMLAVFSVIAIPLIMRLLPADFGNEFTQALESVRWLVLAGAVFCGLFVLFSYGPNRKFSRYCFRSIFWGAFIATAIWIAASVFGSMLVQIFPKLNAAYGSLSAIIALMTWIYISAYTVLIGGAITAVAEQMGCHASPEEASLK